MTEIDIAAVQAAVDASLAIGGHETWSGDSATHWLQT